MFVVLIVISHTNTVTLYLLWQPVACRWEQPRFPKGFCIKYISFDRQCPTYDWCNTPAITADL